MIALAETWSRVQRPVVDCTVIGLILVMGFQHNGGSLPWLAALVAPLAWRRGFPLVVFAITFALAVAAWAVGVTASYVVVALLVTVYSVVRYIRPRVSWVAPTAVGITFVLSWLLGEGFPLADLVQLLSALSVAVLLATTFRARQAYVDQLADRARRSEQERLQQAKIAAAEQRARMAREVHDVVTHNVAVMTSLADGAALAPARSGELVAEIATVGRRALSELQQLIDILRDGEAGSKQPGATIEGIEDLVRSARAAGLRISYETHGVHGLPAPAEAAAHRIVQEALTNTLKHAGPQAIAKVTITCSGDGLDVLVVDQGPTSASDKTGAGRGRGIAGMADRVAALGGTLHAGPDHGGGWKVQAHLRFDRAAAIR